MTHFDIEATHTVTDMRSREVHVCHSPARLDTCPHVHCHSLTVSGLLLLRSPEPSHVTPEPQSESVTTRAGAGLRSPAPREWRREEPRGLCGPGLLHYTPASPAPQSTLLRIMLLKSARSQTGRQASQWTGPGAANVLWPRWPGNLVSTDLGLSGKTCIILATVAP